MKELAVTVLGTGSGHNVWTGYALVLYLNYQFSKLIFLSPAIRPVLSNWFFSLLLILRTFLFFKKKYIILSCSKLWLNQNLKKISFWLNKTFHFQEKSIQSWVYYYYLEVKWSGMKSFWMKTPAFSLTFYVFTQSNWAKLSWSQNLHHLLKKFQLKNFAQLYHLQFLGSQDC